VQYNDILKTLQEEHKLLQDMEADLSILDMKNVASTSGRTSLVRQLAADAVQLPTWMSQSRTQPAATAPV
jgi:hypothetical protein